MSLEDEFKGFALNESRGTTFPETGEGSWASVVLDL